MASFAELVADVYVLTNRADLVAQTSQAVRSATLKAHHTDFYPKDLAETGIQWSAPDYLQSLDYRAIAPRFRSMKYLRKYDASSNPGVAGAFFTLIPPELVLDDYGIQRTEVMYLAGANYEIRSSTQDEFMLLGYYKHPDTTEISYDSWIALDHPNCIVFEAASLIFKQTGFDEQAALYRNLTQELYIELQNSNVLGGGI